MKYLPNIVKKTIYKLFGFKYFVLTASMIFFLIIGIALLLVYQNAEIMRDKINSSFNQQQMVLARQVASQINSDLKSIGMEIEILARSYEKSLSESNSISSLETLYERTFHKGLLAIGIMDSDNNIIALEDTHDIINTYLENEILYDSLRNISDLKLSKFIEYRSKKNGLNLLALFCHKTNVDEGAGAIVFAVLDVTDFLQNIAGEIKSGKTGYCWIIGKYGKILFHPEKNFIGQNIFSALREGKLYFNLSDYNRQLVTDMLESKEGTGIYESGWHRGAEINFSKLIAYTPVKSMIIDSSDVWSVAVAAPISEVAEAIRYVYIRHFAAEGAIIASMFIFAFFLIIYQFRASEVLKEHVHEQENYILSILQSSLDAIIFIDLENYVMVWNSGAEKIFGYTAVEMLGNTFHRLIPPEIDAEAELKRIAGEIAEKGYIRNYLAKRVTKDGRRITIDLSRTVVKNENGEIVGSTAIIKDVTEKMEFESRIYNTEKLASIGNLAAGVAHEINNPLTVILGFSDLLKEKFSKDSQEYEDITIIEENANNAKKIVEDLLGFARVTEGMGEVIDINQSIETVLKIVKNTMVTSKIDLNSELESNLPIVKGDAREFQQVVLNLINNAIAAMEPKGGKLIICSEFDNKWVKVRIKDNGTGIPVKEDNGTGIPVKIKQKIFDPFFTTKEVGKGTGLGLSLCYGIINKYGGEINFESRSSEDEHGKPTGTTFTVAFPINAEDKSKMGGE